VAGARLVDKAMGLALADYFTRPDEFLAQEFATRAAPLRRISSEMCAMPAAAKERKP
jgi:hypothetical protein